MLVVVDVAGNSTDTENINNSDIDLAHDRCIVEENMMPCFRLMFCGDRFCYMTRWQPPLMFQQTIMLRTSQTAVIPNSYG